MSPTDCMANGSQSSDADTDDIPGSRRAGELVAGRYCLLERIGSGGMGDVYEAEHLELGRRFAVKFLRRGLSRHPAIIDRFRREVRVLAMLASEHIVGIVDCGVHVDGAPFLVMERLRGHDLRQILQRDGRLAPCRAINIVLDACRGLRVVHAAGLIHRDLKPANLFVTVRDGGEDLCKILDFGVVKSLTTDSTQPGSVVGTVRYMAPEQLREGAIVGRATDVYALGAILYECLTGAAPFVGATPEEVMFRIMNDDARPLGDVPGVPAGLEAAVLRALAREPAARFADTTEFAKALTPFSGIRNPTSSVAAACDDTTANFAVARSGWPEKTRTWILAAGWLTALSLAALMVLHGFETRSQRLGATSAQPTLPGSEPATESSRAQSPATLVVPRASGAPALDPSGPPIASVASARPSAPTVRPRRPTVTSLPSAVAPLHPVLPIDTQDPYGK